MAATASSADLKEPSMPCQANNHPISTILIFAAMESEAAPILDHLKLDRDDGSVFPLGVPWVRFQGYYNDLNISVVYPGKDPVFGVNSIGTVPASLVTYASIQALRPDIVINAGTAGGFKKGAHILDVFIVSDVAFHHRRNPIPGGRELYAIGRRQSFSTPNLVKKLNLKVGNLSTGDSLDMPPRDEAIIIANDATVVDMEGAAVAYVADILKVPAIFLKAVTNILDGESLIVEEFEQNLQATVLALRDAVIQVLDFINGKCLSEL